MDALFLKEESTVYTSDQNYVLKPDGSTHCVCPGPNSFADAARIARLENQDAMEQRLPHPATDMMPMAHLIDVLHGDPVGRHD